MIYSVEELIKFSNKRKCKYVFFWGHKSNADHTTKACFSQWFPCGFQGESGENYRSAEHYMMVQKAKLFGNDEMAAKILQCSIPAKAKAYGRMIEPFDQSIWDQNKFDIVVEGNLLKFSQNESLKEFLLNTKDRVLVEASPVDRIWGNGLTADHEHAENPNLWKGQNLLGFALMKVRDLLKGAAE
ncbi:NADAR family protein [Kordiimonas lacus]|uniref:NADAR domain-containing protein n=1 Tax=Kordiimonas lacus TaxID=637679 RepID=A0A1G6ZQB5_9PROT|nr:hypothetical protein SAMN04488071_1897 [Kordiimonas lacus]